MALPRLDPRVNVDRVFDYESYRQLRESSMRPKPRSWYRYIPPIRVQYKMAIVSGVILLACLMGMMAYFSADTARLNYSKQEVQANLIALEQSKAEAAGIQVEAENELYSGGVTPAEVVYPSNTKYLVLTNIEEASGKRLLEDLYPLSKRIIRLDP